MRKNFVIALVIFSVAIIIVGGCSNRGERTPTGSAAGSNWAGWPDVDWAFRTSFGSAFTTPGGSTATPPQLLFQLRNPDAILKVDMFIPLEAWPVPTGGGLRVPFLVLLVPENEDQYFYRNRGLHELASQMIADGDIQPMIIVTIGNDPTFGGYFYGNSFGGGGYDAIIADTIPYWDSDALNFNGAFAARGLLSYMENQLGPLILNTPDKRGIGGVGQGSYGAFRAILKHPDVYSSISVSDGPLSFADGLPLLFDGVIAEQRIRWDAKEVSKSVVDPSYVILPFDGNFTMNVFDTSITMPLSRMFVGGAMAFSPNHTDIFYTLYDVDPTRQLRPDSVVIDSATLWTDSANTDTSSTLVDSLIKRIGGIWDFHMPFDASGTRNDVIWSRWMDNDLATLLAADATALDDVNIWIGTSRQAKWNYFEMTEAWISTLGSNVDEVYEYQGYSGNPATDNQYVYDLLGRMLKFHSDNFGTN